ncbi:MAG: DUF1517 domain-containing protein [Sandaracinaceae bacterium]|nr:DUF1517 domain-containing protein [Sandaracinaceae bacterium]
MRKLAVIAALLVSASARAQDTGGSFGGGDFSSSSSDFGGSSSSSDFGGGYDGGGGGGGTLAPWEMAIVFSIVIGITLAAQVYSKRKRRAAVVAHSGLWVASLTIAVDWTARRAIQARLRELAKSGRTDTAGGRAQLARLVVRALHEARSSWLYAAHLRHARQPAHEAEADFRALALDARSRFRQELVRQHEGHVVEQEARDVRARKEEGEGVVVVTVVTATRREPKTALEVTDADAYRIVLQQLRGFADSGALAAIEVVWSPAAEDDRMSTAELEALYPELHRLVGGVGRVTCAHCARPITAELARCPHCGAPTRDQPPA